MSVKLFYSEISQDIIGCLSMKPKTYGKFKKVETKDMYILEEYHIYLPYRFACSITNKIQNISSDHIRFKDINFIGKLRDYQVEVYEEAWDLLSKWNTVTIGMPPGWGKTMLSVLLWSKLKMMGLILTHTKCISIQWLRTLEEYIPELVGCFWVVGETIAPKEGEIPAAIICLVDRFEKIPLKLRKQIGVLIIDEAHSICTTTGIPALLGTQPLKTIAISATLERTDGLETMIQSIVGVYGVFKVSKKPYTVICYNTGIFGEEKYTSEGIDFVKLIKSLASNPIRNRKIIDFIDRNKNKKTIGLTRLTDHIRILTPLLEEKNIKTDSLYGKKEKYSDSQVLLGTIQKIGTGFDEKNACDDYGGTPSNMVLFLLTIGKWQLFEQGRGRVMRCEENPVVVWFLDENKTCKRHWDKISKWIEMTNGKIIYEW